MQLTVGGQIEAISPEGSTMASELWNFVDSFSDYKMGAVHMSSMYNMIKSKHKDQQASAKTVSNADKLLAMPSGESCLFCKASTAMLSQCEVIALTSSSFALPQRSSTHAQFVYKVQSMVWQRHACGEWCLPQPVPPVCDLDMQASNH